MVKKDPVATDYIVDEDFPFYFNDVDLCKRIYNNGYKVFLLPSAEVIHFIGSSFKKANADWKLREFQSSAIKYFKKYHKNKVTLLKLILLLKRIEYFTLKKTAFKLD